MYDEWIKWSSLNSKKAYQAYVVLLVLLGTWKQIGPWKLSFIQILEIKMILVPWIWQCNEFLLCSSSFSDILRVLNVKTCSSSIFNWFSFFKKTLKYNIANYFTNLQAFKSETRGETPQRFLSHAETTANDYYKTITQKPFKPLKRKLIW